MQKQAAKKQAEAKENNATAKAMSLAAGENQDEFREGIDLEIKRD
jgi:hypothetical protein